MGNEQDSGTAAVMIRIPEQLSWVVQRGERSWQGDTLSGFIALLGNEDPGLPAALSLSLIFELTGDRAPLRSDSG